MGGPVTEVCAGRIDDQNGENSIPLESGPLGTVQPGLIYVNPEGVNGNPEPTLSADKIREIFSNMGMNDRETVALIGGGHAFGKSHGICTDGPGPNPEEAPTNPWPGKCSNGIYTSGIEGQWTNNPIQWDNEYFQILRRDRYTKERGPGDKWQWKSDIQANTHLMMQTTDLALVYDDDYYKIAHDYADYIELLNNAFGAAWEKLTTNGGTWANNKKCIKGDQLKYGILAKQSGSVGYMKQSDDNNDNSNTDLIILIIFFVLILIIGLIGWILFFYNKSKNKNHEIELETQINENNTTPVSTDYKSESPSTVNVITQTVD